MRYILNTALVLLVSTLCCCTQLNKYELFLSEENNHLFQEYISAYKQNDKHYMFGIQTEVRESDTLVTFFTADYPLMYDPDPNDRLKQSVISIDGAIVLLAFFDMNSTAEMFHDIKNDSNVESQLYSDLLSSSKLQNIPLK